MFFANIKILSLSNLDNAATTLRQFNRDDLADLIIAEYFNEYASEENIIKLKKLRNSFEVGDIKDLSLLNRLNEIWQSKDFDQRSFAEVIHELRSKSGTSSDDIARLDSFESEDYYNFFKSFHSPELYYCVSTCLELGKFENAPEIYKSIERKTKAALSRLGAESRINQIRVETLYRIKVELNQH